MQETILRKPYGAKLTNKELQHAKWMQMDEEMESGLPVYIIVHDTHVTIERPFGKRKKYNCTISVKGELK